MKPLRLIRFLLLLVTMFMLVVSSTNAVSRLQPSSGGELQRMAATHASMMMVGEAPCDGCPCPVVPLAQTSHCAQCISWMPVTLFLPLMLAYDQPPYLTSVLPLSWTHPQSLPWKPPRIAVLNA